MNPDPGKPPAPEKAMPLSQSSGETHVVLARRTAWVAGCFCFMVGLLVVVNYSAGLSSDPINSTELAGLKATLTKRPADEDLKKTIRQLDLDLRRKQTIHQIRASLGGWLLLGGAIVFLAALKSATYRKKLRRPDRSPASVAEARASATWAQWSVAGLGLILVAGAGYLLEDASTDLTAKLALAPTHQEPAQGEVAVANTPFPTTEEIQRNWPRFRGPAGSGISAYTNVPVTWNVQTGEGVAWKSAVPLYGPNSPVVWENRVFVIGSTAKRREFYCFDTGTGKLLWQQVVELAESSSEPPSVMEDTGGYSPSTAATDGRRVYAIFANGDVAAFDYKGIQAWARNLGKPDNSYGHASSLELYQNRLLIQFDQGGGKDNKSKLLALDTATGQTVWESQPRPVPNSWSSPILIQTSQRPQIITCGNPWVIAYDPSNGSEIWRVRALAGEVTPSPVFSGGLVCVAMESEKLWAIKPDGVGDVTTTHVAWTAEDGLPDICSPLADGQRIYLLTTPGTLTCYQLATGKKLWEKELGSDLTFHASPSLVGDRIWLITVTGIVIQVAAANEYKDLGRVELGDEVLASPAFSDGRAFFRTKKNLICVGKK
jgi:outer membrane protein assembly factor BamB